MCNNYKLTTAASAMADLFRGIHDGQGLAHPEGVANLEPNDDIRIGDTAPVVILHDNRYALVTRPWSWTGPAGKPVFNLRSEGRAFGPGQRCLIPADGFYEFTAPTTRARLKDRWLFTHHDAPWFWILGVLRDGAFAMLTTQAGPDVQPYHHRQVVTLPALRPQAWLGLGSPDFERSDLERPDLKRADLKRAAPPLDMRFDVSAAPRV